ncbi:MAG: hypothetical protein V4760_07935 [Bdellovibrionota bacterium]
MKRGPVAHILGFFIAVIVTASAFAREKLASPPVSPSASTPAASPQPPPALALHPPPQLSIRKDAAKSELPFWKTKPDIRKRLADRDIIVSVKNDDVKRPDGKKVVRFTINGVGHVSRNKDTAFKIAQQYSKLKEVSSHFKTVNYDANRGEVFMICEALGYQARMIMKMTPVSEDWRSEIQWEVIWGHFQGMKGTLGFEKVDETHTEVSIVTNYEAETLPLPRVLMGFAFEVISQKVAEKMRTHLESMPEPR